MWWIVLALAVLLGSILFVYNAMVSLENRVQASLGDMDALLKKRHDLIPNLVTVTQGYASHEHNVFRDVASLRTGKSLWENPRERDLLEHQLSSRLNNFFVLMEDYPELQASSQYQSLHRTLLDVEEDLSRGRRYYNAVVRDYNTLIHSFPVSLLARLFRREPLPFFAVEENERSVPLLSV